MTDDSGSVKSHIKQKGYEVQALQEEANRLVLPDDIPRLIESWSIHAENLSDELPQKSTIKKLLRVALNDFNLNDMQQVRLGILRAMKNFENAYHDKWVIGVQKQYGHNVERLRQINKETVKPKHDLWQKICDDIRSKRQNPIISKIELARQIKGHLDKHCPDESASVEHIRKVIK